MRKLAQFSATSFLSEQITWAQAAQKVRTLSCNDKAWPFDAVHSSALQLERLERMFDGVSLEGQLKC